MKNEDDKKNYKAYLSEKYLKNGLRSMDELEILELFLFYAVKSDISSIKKTAKSLYESFDCDLEKIFNADIGELERVDGMNKNSAILFHLLKDAKRAAMIGENRSIKKISTAETAKKYIKNILSDLVYEKIILVTLDSKNKIIACHEVSSGSVNYAKTDMITIVKHVINDGASAVLLAHNHPSGPSYPSIDDRYFTQQVLKVFGNTDIEVKDHIIVGKKDVFSMRYNKNI